MILLLFITLLHFQIKKHQSFPHQKLLNKNYTKLPLN